jgi:uncharacterized protein YndB with AHSA1/START domain
MPIGADTFSVVAVGDQEIEIQRSFQAPRRMVFDAWTRPELVKRWLGVREGWMLAVCEIDLRVGGAYRFAWCNESRGIDMGMGGIYKDVVIPERIVCTELFDDAWYSGAAIVTTVFAEQKGETKVTMTIRYESREAREGVMKSGMQTGLQQSYDALAELLELLKQQA